jgi:hypothetical protein
MFDPSQTVRSVAAQENAAAAQNAAAAEGVVGGETVEAQESVTTFEWRRLHLHVVTSEPLSADQARALKRMMPKVDSVGYFADLVGAVLGRSVRIRTVRPSPDIRLEVGR